MKEKVRDSVALGQEKIEKMKELLLKLSLRNTEFYKYKWLTRDLLTLHEFSHHIFPFPSIVPPPSTSKLSTLSKSSQCLLSFL
jgi:hypothetical protein